MLCHHILALWTTMDSDLRSTVVDQVMEWACISACGRDCLLNKLLNGMHTFIMQNMTSKKRIVYLLTILYIKYMSINTYINAHTPTHLIDMLITKWVRLGRDHS